MNSKLVGWILRIGIAGTFMGHGTFALQGEPGWVEWFSNFGISDPALAVKLLFLIGLFDWLLAVLVLIKPFKSALLWMTLWGLWTAVLRPIVGEPIWEMIERSANWAAPLALYYLIGGKLFLKRR